MEVGNFFIIREANIMLVLNSRALVGSQLMS